jgi:hypothetical protein
MEAQVSNCTSRNGNKVANQFIIEVNNSIIFQSYDSVIAKKENERIFLDEKYWNYSKTTGKYRNLFLGEDKKETQKKIDSGEYVLTNLN